MRLWAGKRIAFPRPRPRGTPASRPSPRAQREASARPGGRWPAALGPRLAWGQRGAVAGAMASAIEAVKGLSSIRAEPGNALSFPARARRFPVDRQVQAHRRSAPDPAGEKRPPGAGRALAGGFGPPAGQGSAWRCGRGDGPCHGSGERAFVGAGGMRKRTAFPPPVRDGAPQIGRSGHNGRPAPAGSGWALAGGFGPRRAWDQRAAVAGAMAPAIEAVKGLSSVRAGTGNALRFPARARRFPVDRQVQAHRRPAPDPEGEKRPPGAGRALAGGFGPPAGLGSAWRRGRGDGPCH
jgi:hypothetical protein